MKNGDIWKVQSIVEPSEETMLEDNTTIFLLELSITLPFNPSFV
jgi:hypothetical protein